MKPTFEKDQSINDCIAECEFMMAYHAVDLRIVSDAEDLSPVGEYLAREFIARKLEQIRSYRECLKQLQAKL